MILRKKYIFGDKEVVIEKITYSSKRLGLILLDAESKAYVVNATVDYYGARTPNKHIIVKDYGENHGMYNFLFNNKIIGNKMKKISIGFNFGFLCKVLI